MSTAVRHTGVRVRRDGRWWVPWWSVLLLLAGAALVGPGAAPARGSDHEWVPAGPTVALTVQTRSWVRAGTPFTVTVTARDAAGAVVPSYRGMITLVTDDRRAPVLPAEYTFTAADAGTHTFTGVELHTAGTRVIAVNDAADHWITGAASVRVSAGPVARLAVWAPTRTVVGAPVDVRVAATDAWKNWVVSYRGTVALTSSDPLVRSLPGPYTFTAADRGSHVFPGVVLGSVGRWHVVATDTLRPELTGAAPTRVEAAPAG